MVIADGPLVVEESTSRKEISVRELKVTCDLCGKDSYGSNLYTGTVILPKKQIELYFAPATNRQVLVSIWYAAEFHSGGQYDPKPDICKACIKELLRKELFGEA